MWQHPTVDERTVWDGRYRRGEYVPRSHPSPFLVEWLARIPAGLALDIACGAGRNSFALAEAGFSVEAIDISNTAIDMARQTAAERSLSINWHVSNVREFHLPAATYNLITVFRYRDPQLWPRLIESLARRPPSSGSILKNSCVPSTRCGSFTTPSRSNQPTNPPTSSSSPGSPPATATRGGELAPLHA